MTKLNLFQNRLVLTLIVLGAFIASFSLISFTNQAVKAADVPDDATLDFYNANGIYYYNPNGGCVDESGGSTGVVSGKDYASKIWNYFVTANISGVSDNPAAIAGILGNLKLESDLNPFNTTGKYYGLYQTDSSAVIKAVSELGDYWGKSDVPNDIKDQAIKIELDWLLKDTLWSDKRWSMYVDALKKYKIGNTAEDAKKAAELFMLAVERCYDQYEKHSPSPLEYEESKQFAKTINSVTREYADKMWQATKQRRDYATQYYEEFANSTSTSTSNSSSSSDSSSSTTSDGSNVTIIGDSITEMSKSAIEKLLPKADIRAKVGRQFAKTYDDSGTEILEKIISNNNLRSILVFALGTNDAGLKESQAKEVVKLAQDNNAKLIFVTNYDSKSKNKYTKNNALFESLAKKNEGEVIVVDWASAAGADPSKYISSDGIHPTTEGEELFAKLIADAVSSASSSNSNSSSNDACATSGGNSPYTGDGIPEYSQCDSRWGGYHYAKSGIGTNPPTTYQGMKAVSDSICNSACGPTSFAMMATALLGQNILPDETADIAGKAGMHIAGEGSSHEVTRVLAQHYGLEYKALDTCNIDTINEYLRDGWMIHTSGKGSRPFSSRGHYIGIAGINSNGQWLIANSGKEGNKYYDPSTVVNAGMWCNNVKAIKNK